MKLFKAIQQNKDHLISLAFCSAYLSLITYLGIKGAKEAREGKRSYYYGRFGFLIPAPEQQPTPKETPHSPPKL